MGTPLLSACNLRGLETNSFVHLTDIYQAPIMCQASAKVLGSLQRKKHLDSKGSEATRGSRPTPPHLDILESGCLTLSMSKTRPPPHQDPPNTQTSAMYCLGKRHPTHQRPARGLTLPSATSTLSSVPRFPSYIPQGRSRFQGGLPSP